MIVRIGGGIVAEHKQLQSLDKRLSVKRAGKAWECAGVMIERGTRPDHLEDVWMVAHARRCAREITQGELYIGNRLLPKFVIQVMNWSYDWPTCLHCAVEFYEEYLTGPLKIELLPPVTPEMVEEMTNGLREILEDMRQIV
jgi:hypothetical protein